MQEHGIVSYVAWGRGRKPENNYEISIEDNVGIKFHGIYTRITDKTGFASRRATIQFIKKLREISPDIIHLHNIHGYFINIEILFDYIRENKIKVIWTLHDCWTFTGHCAYFDMIGCEKWKTGCYECQQKESYPSSQLTDNSIWNYQKKKELFTGLDIRIITVSKWLATLVKKSFLREYPIEVINNGIDLDVFKPTESDFRKKYNLLDKFIILGVASEWTERKGLKDFIKLAKLLDNKYAIVIVGLTKKQKKEVGERILGFSRSNNAKELVEIYSAADLFLNASVEETMGMTTVEAMACGTAPIVYDATALPEVMGVETSRIVPKHDIDRVIEIIKVSKQDRKTNNYFIKIASLYDKRKKFMQYIDLYRKVDCI
jgi:glycosyltransferase involved in cell wall biosynthesis